MPTQNFLDSRGGTNSMAEQEVLNTLIGVTNEVKEVREEAERRLQQYTFQPGYGGILIRIMSTSEVPLPYRQVSNSSPHSSLTIASWLDLSSNESSVNSGMRSARREKIDQY